MSIDSDALTLQLHQIHMDIYADLRAQREALVSAGQEWLTDERDALLNLASAIGVAASLANVVTTMRTRLRCGCGEPAIGRDITGSPICAGCRSLEATALEELAAIEHAIPTQPDGSDR